MKIINLIEKKKLGQEHTKEEIDLIVESLTSGTVADYQISAWLMAVYFNGLSELEVLHLTNALINSGETLEFSEQKYPPVDIHSTGGVGDKVSLILIPLLAAAGIPVIKLMGRGLGYTGSTIDKLKSIPGFKAKVALPDVNNYLRDNGFVISSRINNITPANSILQGLKFATSVTNSIPLIAASVLSKKIACGAPNIVIDIKYGSGSNIKSPEDAEKLAELMINIGERLNKKITIVITSIDEPIGRTVGNSLEVIEAIEFLKGKIQIGDLPTLVYETGAVTLMQYKHYDSIYEAKEYLRYLVESGTALNKFREIIKKQRGNVDVINKYDTFTLPQYKIQCKSNVGGFINRIDGHDIAYACKILGTTRNRLTDEIDKSTGIFLNKKTGEFVEEGEVLFTIYSNSNLEIEEVKKYCYNAYSISNLKDAPKNLVYKIIRND